MPRVTITRENAAEVFARYDIEYSETKTGDEVNNGFVKVGELEEGFRWSAAGKLPPRHKVWALLRSVPQFAADYPAVGQSATKKQEGDDMDVMKVGAWKDYSSEDLEQVKVIIDRVIERRIKQERKSDLQAAAALLAKHGMKSKEVDEALKG